MPEERPKGMMSTMTRRSAVTTTTIGAVAGTISGRIGNAGAQNQQRPVIPILPAGPDFSETLGKYDAGGLDPKVRALYEEFLKLNAVSARQVFDLLRGKHITAAGCAQWQCKTKNHGEIATGFGRGGAKAFDP
jgi:hypothetical protein